MKNSTILFSCLFALVSIIGFSCKKEAEEIIFTEVEYGILDIDESIVSITYIDASGNPVVIDDLSQFVNGSKKISVSTKPFTARLELLINNTTNNEKSYTLGILVNGDVVAIKPVYCPSSGMALGEVEFTIQ